MLTHPETALLTSPSLQASKSGQCVILYDVSWETYERLLEWVRQQQD